MWLSRQRFEMSKAGYSVVDLLAVAPLPIRAVTGHRAALIEDERVLGWVSPRVYVCNRLKEMVVCEGMLQAATSLVRSCIFDSQKPEGSRRDFFLKPPSAPEKHISTNVHTVLYNYSKINLHQSPLNRLNCLSECGHAVLFGTRRFGYPHFDWSAFLSLHLGVCLPSDHKFVFMVDGWMMDDVDDSPTTERTFPVLEAIAEFTLTAEV